MSRNEYQRRAYAMRRLSLACDRAILEHGDPVKNRLWARAWAERCFFRTPRRRIRPAP